MLHSTPGALNRMAAAKRLTELRVVYYQFKHTAVKLNNDSHGLSEAVGAIQTCKKSVSTTSQHTMLTRVSCKDSI